MDQLIASLGKALSADQTLLNESLTYFSGVAVTDYEWLVGSLAVLIVEPVHVPPEYHCLAALQLKNLIRLQSAAWLTTDASTRLHVKNCLLASVQSSEEKLSGGITLCIQAVAEIELPRTDWPELLPFLLSLTMQDGNPRSRSAALETLGFICESVNADYLAEHVNNILTVMVHNARCADEEISCAALKALFNAIELASPNFARLGERNCLMQILCESTQRSNCDIALVALQCLSRVISLYYPLLEAYLDPAIFPISVSAIVSGKEAVVVQGLELINSLCDAELELTEDGDQEANWLSPALGQILPPIIQVLICDLETVEDWSVGKAGQVTIRLLSKCAGDHVLPPVLPFLELNLTSPDPQLQGAALSCLAAVLEGPMESSLLPLIHALIDLLGSILESKCAKVRVNGAMASSQLCLFHPQSVIDLGRLPYLLEMMVCGLALDSPAAEYCCSGVNSLLRVIPDARNDAAINNLYCPSLTALMSATDLSFLQGNLVQLGYETLSNLLSLCPDQQLQTLQQVLDQLMRRLGCSPSGTEGFLLLAIESALMRVGELRELVNLDPVIGTFCTLLTASYSSKEELLSILSNVISSFSNSYVKYTAVILSSLQGCILQSTSHDSLLCSAAGLIGDVFRCSSSQSNSKPAVAHWEGFVRVLVDLVLDPSRPVDLKTCCLGALGDIIVCIGRDVLPVLNTIIDLVNRASHDVQHGRIGFPPVDDELVKSVIDIHSALIQTLGEEEGFRELFAPDSVVTFIQQISTVFSQVEDITFSLCGLIGDLYKHMPDQDSLEDETWFIAFLQAHKSSEVSRVRKIARWALNQLNAACNSSSSIIKKARVNESSRHEVYSMKVTLSCSGQYITQNIEEESVTLTLNAVPTNEENCNHVAAVVKLPRRDTADVVYRPVSAADDDVTQLRRLRKKRVAVILEGPKKKSRDDDEEVCW